MESKPPSEKDKLLEKCSTGEEATNNKKSYGFVIAVSGKEGESESLLNDQKMDESNQKLTLLTLAQNSPSKEDAPNDFQDKNQHKTLPDNDSVATNNSDNIPTVDQESDILNDSRDLDIPGEMPSYETNDEACNEVNSCSYKEKACRKHLQLSLNVEAAAKRNSKIISRINDSELLTPTSHGTPKPMNVAVFLKEGDGRLLSLERGKFTTAGELKSMMLENLSIPRSASHLFAIWFISPYLEIQLKEHHIPFLLRKQWPNLLTTFSSCQDNNDAMKDEPVLVFQRNSFLTITEEEKFHDETVVKRLFEEARHNILMSRYPIPCDDAQMLGGMLVRIDEGAYDANTHKLGYFKKNLCNYLPYYAIGSNKIIQFMKSSSSEQRLIDQFQHASNKADDIKTCQKTFLEYCRSLPFYGCAFFKGKIDHDVKEYKLWKANEKQVIVGINRVGLSIFKANKEELLLHLSFDDLSWNYIKDTTTAECLDTFCIEYDLLDDNNEQVPQQIHILSKQACMMDSMVDSCINYMNIMKIPKTPTSADHRKILDISYSMNTNKKHNFSLSRPFKR